MRPLFTFGILVNLLSCHQTPEISTAVAAPVTRAKAVQVKLDYNRDVLPILSNYCYHCHGPDTSHRKAKLRLDLRAEALEHVCDSGKKVIVPGKPEESELVVRVECTDPDEMMPQDPDKRLNPEQIKLLRRWIAEGAEFRDHWAFEAPKAVSLPQVKDKSWVKTPIDSFILAKLEEQGLKPNAEAERRQLIRRVSLDLTGLPPTPEEIEAFVKDPADTDAAYGKLVDRLLASPAYGEHRGRYWLDYARYGDTHGIHVDPYRSIWPYRDYVIKSFNADKPFDRFATEQLAGDLLPDGDLDALVATGFVRAGIASGEGGGIPQDMWCSVKRERSEAFGVTFMGMSTGCAVCHDHKYDPITQRDFYSLSAYFGNLTEKPWHDDTDNWLPFQVLPKPEDRAAFETALTRKSKAQAALQKILENSEPQVATWLRSPQGPQALPSQDLLSRFKLDEGAAGKGEIRDAVSGKTHKFEAAPPLWDEYPLLSGSFRLDNNTRYQIPEIGDFEADQPFTVSTWVRWNEEPLGQGSGSGTILSKMDGSGKLRGWDLFLEGGRISMHLIHTWPGEALKASSSAALTRMQWTHVTASYDGSGKAAGIKFYLNGQAVGAKIDNDKLSGSIRTSVPFNFGRRGGDEAGAAPLRGVGLLDLRLYKKALPAEEVARLPILDPLAEVFKNKPDYPGSWTPFERDAARKACFAEDTQVKALKAEIAQARQEMEALSAKVKVVHYQGANNIHEGKKVSDSLVQMYEGKLGAGTLVCQEKPSPAFAHVLGRGEYGSRLERVYAATPSFLPPPPAGAPANRLGLAQWLTMPENPLTARVAVNRIWLELFGTGLVETAEDFGIVGERPSHPELLDWLALDFRQNGWKMKRVYRQMVMSMAYRQSARIVPANQEKDPHNRLLSRSPRFRLDAEALRDSALFAAGLLNQEKIGGPSFLGYQPDGVWSNSYPSDTHLYHRHPAPLLYRRSLYQFVKRTAVHPELDIFDGTDRLAACARRNRTNTPLAALAMMNDVTFLEAARVLAQHALEKAPSPEARLDLIARKTFGRSLSPAETAAYQKRLSSIQTQLTAESAKQLLKQGDSPLPASLNPEELAAWMALASIFLNSDEFMNK
ncbi:MAG: hypothetical protein RL095_2878 [Verrucomicrobiota bacterium]|jgi:hypothetical protein